MNDFPPRDHNQPPSSLDYARGTDETIGAWLVEHPVLTSPEEAGAAKRFLDQGRLSWAEAEDERKRINSPHDKAIKETNELYKPITASLDKTCLEVQTRLDNWIKNEKEAREKEAAEAAKTVAFAKEAALAAEAAERGARDDASHGVVIDVNAATAAADAAFNAYQKAEREAARMAEAADNVKVIGGFRRAYSTRTKKELVITDVFALIKTLRHDPDVIVALKKAAKRVHRECGVWPEGITQEKK